MTTFHAEYAWLGGEDLATDVAIEVDDGLITAVTPDSPRQGTRLVGVTFPAFVDAHSHAFHRALRSRTHRQGGDFWSWRSLMYRAAGRLDPDTYEELATAVYAEAALAGIGTVGEFHYLHHRPGGKPYDDPNTMGRALVRAAGRSGVRLVLLDALYLRSDFDQPLTGTQQRFGDRDVDTWAMRVADLRSKLSRIRHATLGVAAHSVRAVPPEALAVVAEVAAKFAVPVHVHLSEQPAENKAAYAATRRTPTELLFEAGLVAPGNSVVHASHLTFRDVAVLGGGEVTVVMCPTTEADLGDGLGLASDLVAAGTRLAVGTDSHAVVDLIEEVRRIEQHDRMRTLHRGVHAPHALIAAATSGGAASLGLPGGSITVGAPADLTTVSLQSVRFAGADPHDLLAAVIFAANADDVSGLVVNGRVVVQDGVHQQIPDVGRRLDTAITRTLETISV